MEHQEENSDSRSMLRHAVATVAYRGGKSITDLPADFADFRISETARTPREILAHIGDLFDWALWLARGEHKWTDSLERDWNAEVVRFFDNLEKFDEYLASGERLGCSCERLFQGPVADALTHVGQIALIRRAAGVPIKGENYFVAEIQKGRVGPQQSLKRKEFD